LPARLVIRMSCGQALRCSAESAVT